MQEHKYHFVKFTPDGIWYLKPECLADVTEHFEKIFGQEIKEGVHDYVSSLKMCKDPEGRNKPWTYKAHPTTPWNTAVSIMNDIYKGPAYTIAGSPLPAWRSILYDRPPPTSQAPGQR